MHVLKTILAVYFLIMIMPALTGTIHGTVSLKQLPALRSDTRSRPYDPTETPIESPLELRGKTLMEVVISISDDNPLDGEFTTKLKDDSEIPPSKEIIQINKTFIPFVLPIVKGTTVNFPNRDPFFHNVFSLSPISRFDLGKYSQQSNPKSHTFNQVGISQIFCDIHRNMKAYVLILENSYFTQPNRTGGFTLTNLPEGKWYIRTWHPHYRESKQEVHVDPQSEIEVNFELEIK